MTASAGALGQFGIGSTSPVTQRLEFAEESLVMTEAIIDGNGVKGTRERSIDRVRGGLQRITGNVRFQPNAVEWAALLPWFTGGTPTGSPTVTYPLADSLTGKYVTVDRVAKVYTYNGVVPDTATIRGRENMPIELDLGLVGLTETQGNSGTFPALSLDTTNGPFVFSDAVIVVGGTTITCKEFELQMDNRIDKERFFNGLTLSAAVAHDRHTMFRSNLPFGDWNALYGSAGAAGATITVTCTNANAVLTISLVKVAFPRTGARVAGRTEVMLPIAGEAFKSGATASVVITLNPGP